MRIGVLLAMSAVIVCSPCFAEDDISMIGGGQYSCGEFAEAYARDPKFTEGLFFAWATGYMSGRNDERIIAREKTQDLSSRSVDEMKAAIRLYCDQHPLALYVQAVNHLFRSFEASEFRRP
jgi:hypothetical protein